MTAEIAILNKNGLALAADSAVTISVSGKDESKIYNSANKLFALSKFAPIGIMVYDSADIMGVPWETVIKLYRMRLGKRQFRFLRDYCDDFIVYLEREWDSHAGEEKYVRDMATAVYMELVKVIDEEVKKTIDTVGRITNDQIEKICADKIKKEYVDWLAQRKRVGEKPSAIVAITKKFQSTYKQLITEIFEKRPINKLGENQLFEIASTFSLLTPGISNSGVVIAGYGERECFPAVYGHTIGKILNGEATVTKEREQVISHSNEAAIIAFAQASEVFTFMEGMGSQLQTYFDTNLGKILKESFPKMLADDLKKHLGLDEKIQAEVFNIISNMGEGVHDYVVKDLKVLRQNKYSTPVIRAVSFLSVSDLAVMAETFVNLESFRKRITFTTETVGGPIDVAVITKGDGLIWMKRKHYFEKNLNHHFFANYYLEGATDGKKKKIQ